MNEFLNFNGKIRKIIQRNDSIFFRVVNQKSGVRRVIAATETRSEATRRRPLGGHLVNKRLMTRRVLWLGLEHKISFLRGQNTWTTPAPSADGDGRLNSSDSRRNRFNSFESNWIWQRSGLSRPFKLKKKRNWIKFKCVVVCRLKKKWQGTEKRARAWSVPPLR